MFYLDLENIKRNNRKDTYINTHIFNFLKYILALKYILHFYHYFNVLHIYTHIYFYLLSIKQI